MEDNRVIIELTDENGDILEFEYVATVELGNKSYAILALVKDEDVDDVDEMVVLEWGKTADGVETLVSIESEEEEQQVFDAFQALLDQEPNDVN